MRLSIDSMEHWEFGALGIHNPKSSTLAPYFDLITQTENISGDILELGVLRGASLITSGLLLEKMNSRRSLLGVDTFSGFPGFSKEDDFSEFDNLAAKSLISADHLAKVKRNKELVNIRGVTASPNSISNSANFSETSLELVQNRIRSLELEDRIQVKQIDISEEIEGVLGARALSLVLMDVDLFLPYSRALPVLFKNLTPGGVVYLDEYYSLKFPGPRIAVNSFLKHHRDAELKRLGDWLDFERWVIRKLT